jgi:TolB-like protein/Flp pilus assembly protein TadD
LQPSEHKIGAAGRERAATFRVGEWRVSRAINQIERHGHALQLEPLAMDVLVHLATKPGEVVSIDELIARIWNGRATDGSVYRTINQLRRALEGDSEEARYIETIRKRGYRLVAEVHAAAPGSESERAGSSTSTARTSIAVLPFENLSPDRENAFFADGMHGEVLSQLAKISSLRVISRTSVLEYRDSAKNIRQIAKELGVGTILEGTVQRSGGSARINVQLIDAERDEHIWAQIFDRKLTAENVLAIQSEIATAVAAALHAALLPYEAVRLSTVPTKNAAAYDFYLTGNAQLDNAHYGEPRGWLDAIESYQRAVQQDPNFALAWTALSRMHALVYHLFIDRTKARITAASDALERARALDPDMPEFHLAAGEYYYRSSSDHGRALAEFDLAARGMPDAPELLFARALVYKRLGCWEQALDTFEQARILDPRSTRLIFNQADTYISMREYEVANEYLRRILAIDPNYLYADVWRANISLLRDGEVTSLKSLPPGTPWVYHLRWVAALYERDYAAACKLLDGWDPGIFVWPWHYELKSLAYGVIYDLWARPDDAKRWMLQGRAQIDDALAKSTDDPRLLIALGEALAVLGEHDEAIRAGRGALAMRTRSQDAYLSLIYQLDAVMRVFVRAGAVDEAIIHLDDYLGTRGAAWTIEGLLPDPRLDRIRDDPRFVALVERHRRR